MSTYKMYDMSEEDITNYQECLEFALSPKVEPSDKMYPETPTIENTCSKNENRRGRPKAAMITNLILEGSASKNGIRCDICSRVFPRDKSLQAHRRVHTGERPYSCDYPGCLRKFKQSGQLKTHQRLHTGERPFLCSAEGCNSRFTHANRHCSSHPNSHLIRSDDFALFDSPEENQSEEVKQWFLKYRAERREARSCDKKRAESPRHESVEEGSPSPCCDLENRTPSPKNSQTRKSLFGPDSPRKREIPKKRWLRIASREQDLANLTRPTVLRHVGHFSSPPLNSVISLSSLPTPPSDRIFSTASSFDHISDPNDQLLTQATSRILIKTEDEMVTSSSMFGTSPLSSCPSSEGPRRNILIKAEEDELAVPLPLASDSVMSLNSNCYEFYQTGCY